MKNRNFLIIDDDESHRELLSLALKQAAEDSIVHCAASGDAAVRASVPDGGFDCCFVDFHLGDCQADELIHDLRQIHPQCPFVVVSSSDEQEVAVRSIRSGSVDFINKNDAIDDEKLRTRLEFVFDKLDQKAIERRRQDRRVARLVEASTTDPLTGLSNRRYFDHLLEGSTRKTFDRRDDTAAILFDIDHFKQINDRFGHSTGDRVLKVVADLIRRSVSESDHAIRWGGEEFLIIQTDSSLARSLVWAERLRTDLSTLRVNANKREIEPSASFGIVAVPSPAFRPDVIDRADEALYFAKRNGRDRCCVSLTSEFVAGLSDTDFATFQNAESTIRRVSENLGAMQREYVSEHSCEVSELARGLGEALGLPTAAVARLRLAGRLHDIGKVAIPESVLAKSGLLTADEQFMMARHPAEGAEIAAIGGADAATAGLIRNHHAVFNENGNELDLESQILPVADAMSAMSAERPYARRRDSREILEELRKERGRQFHPEVVDAAICHLLTTSAAS